MKRLIIYRVLSLIMLLGLLSCEKYLEELPDNRAELNSNDKIKRILVSAYPANSYLMATEISSDNVDDVGPFYTDYSRFVEELYKWNDSKDSNNDDVGRIWIGCYSAISSANTALEAIEEAGDPLSLSAEKGEALVARAYSHWILVNIFAHNYAEKYSSTDLGITYMDTRETTLNPKYTRHTVAEVYRLIFKDLEEGLPLIDDALYANSSVSKYHFNKEAAYTFASRVALFMENWPKVIEYANIALGDNPNTTLRDYTTIASFSATYANLIREYNASTIKANFLISTSTSISGRVFGGYSVSNRIAHAGAISRMETVFARQPYGQTTSTRGYRIRASTYASTTINKVLLPRVGYMFATTDVIAGTGLRKAIYASITSEEALLNRAEANIHLKNYTAALVDMNIHAQNNTLVNPSVMTLESVNNWANSFAYFEPINPTPKKHLNPEFIIEQGTQENMIHAILSLRRIQFLFTGMRWFDVKRYGIEITRREAPATVSNLNAGYTVTDNTLVVRDARRALQLPQDVISAGLTPNPR
ncbi:RagB/SusD family nutrient uptake outer membrane protein [Sphingobacterium rhinopitheci]|uniref:RagB/SusD family nutrient uptake outer membrane protein n=1 Tax=Sphingobacterium rhinopitheci TaxID=2781960 RepID=UPI001F51D76D|nr:RagB/SusD family nutrient uptake outer membrane protein [Sphingobacterium rhinopitheci]MCI0920459.1 RagB/SusD family nutrient uptake outer membrane protein [Sphingobacterium rhinopitheci]